MRRIALSLWLASGVALLVHDAITGGGVAGYLLYREITDLGAIETAPTYVGLAVPLIALPAFLLMPRGRKLMAEPPLTPRARRVTIILSGLGACVLAGVAMLALNQARSVPGRDAPVVRLALDATPLSLPPGGVRVILRGAPRMARSVSYREVISGRYGPDVQHSHDLVPLTEADWTPERPVRFVTDLRGSTRLPGLPPIPGVAYQETAPGVLLTDAVPTYLVRAFAARGVTLAADARLHTTDAAAARETWYGIATVAAVFAAASMLAGWVIR